MIFHLPTQAPFEAANHLNQMIHFILLSQFISRPQAADVHYVELVYYVLMLLIIIEMLYILRASYLQLVYSPTIIIFLKELFNLSDRVSFITYWSQIYNTNIRNFFHISKLFLLFFKIGCLRLFNLPTPQLRVARYSHIRFYQMLASTIS